MTDSATIKHSLIIGKKVVSTAPKRIWLDLGFDPSDESEISFHKLNDVTWSHDNATGYGVEYVRADTIPAQREWVGLTGEELRDVARSFKGNTQRRFADHWDEIKSFIDKVEAKLKEKNT